MQGLWLISYGGLWLLVVLEGLVLLALARQIGILHARLGPVGARLMNSGPEIGDVAPLLDVPDLAGRRITLGDARAKRTLLVFVTLTCSSCEQLLSGLRAWRRTEQTSLEIVLVTAMEDRAEAREFVARHRLESFPLVLSRELTMQYRIGTVPYAILVDREGRVRAKGLVNNVAHVESLLNAEEIGHPSIQSYLEARDGRHDAPEVLTSGDAGR